MLNVLKLLKSVEAGEYWLGGPRPLPSDWASYVRPPAERISAGILHVTYIQIFKFSQQLISFRLGLFHPRGMFWRNSRFC